MNNPDTKSVLCGVLACAAALFAVLTVYFYSNSANLTAELADANASLTQAQTAAAQADDLAAQLTELQTQLDAAKADLSEKADEEQNVYDLTQQAYEEGWKDACWEYDLEPDEDDIGGYDYTAHLDDGEEPASPTAYITPTGKRYHLSQSCAGKNAIETTVSKATEQGYTPCIKCAQKKNARRGQTDERFQG